jgi:hypothetical protein
MFTTGLCSERSELRVHNPILSAEFIIIIIVVVVVGAGIR